MCEHDITCSSVLSAKSVPHSTLEEQLCILWPLTCAHPSMSYFWMYMFCFYFACNLLCAMAYACMVIPSLQLVTMVPKWCQLHLYLGWPSSLVFQLLLGARTQKRWCKLRCPCVDKCRMYSNAGRKREEEKRRNWTKGEEEIRATRTKAANGIGNSLQSILE